MLPQNVEHKRGYPVIRDIIEGKGYPAQSALRAMKLENMRVFHSELRQAQMVLAYSGFSVLRSGLSWLRDRWLLLFHGGILYCTLPYQGVGFDFFLSAFRFGSSLHCQVELGQRQGLMRQRMRLVLQDEGDRALACLSSLRRFLAWLSCHL
ncbi:hypothetical protein J27TS7_05810 [Paenibacillus dendritiformis]|nr:hypothetical protein J27TS7_05810 [Paenibacillus dendritiformis]